MIERAFQFLFALALVAPPAAVVIGALFLAVHPRRPRRVGHAARPVRV